MLWCATQTSPHHQETHSPSHQGLLPAHTWVPALELSLAEEGRLAWSNASPRAAKDLSVWGREGLAPAFIHVFSEGSVWLRDHPPPLISPQPALWDHRGFCFHCITVELLPLPIPASSTPIKLFFLKILSNELPLCKSQSPVPIPMSPSPCPHQSTGSRAGGQK